MEKRRMENIDVETSLLGFGCMRFPTLPNGEIDEERTAHMLDMALKNGVNYIDTAYPYHDGKSESVVGKILEHYDRDSFYLATKLPIWAIEKTEDGERIFEEQLKKLRTDHIDFYLLHALNRGSFQKCIDLKLVEMCERLQKEGRIRYFGFSFHDSYDAFEWILNYRKWDFCQIQLNYMDTEDGPGLRGYELTEKAGVPLVIMEPVKGGSLVNLSAELVENLQAVNPSKSTASFALRWVGSLPNVKVILSGMSTEEQVQDNLSTFSPFVPLGEAESKAIEHNVEIMKNRVQNGCTGCRYCMPCPMGVDIPTCFRIWNKYHMFQNREVVSWDWNQGLAKEAKPTACIECGKCEKACPQHIAIREDLKKVMKDLG